MLLSALVLAPAVQGGAWMRDSGHGFSSASVTLRRDDSGRQQHELSLYADYGWSDRLTLGIDLNQNDRWSGHAMLFARRRFGPVRTWPRLAVEFAVGGNHQLGEWRYMYRSVLSAGHEFHMARTSGWISVDATYEHTSGNPDPLWKLDATLGLRTGTILSPMLQVETSRRSGDALSYAIIPSLRYRLDRRSELIVGLEHKKAAERSLGLRIALWHRF